MVLQVQAALQSGTASRSEERRRTARPAEASLAALLD